MAQHDSAEAAHAAVWHRDGTRALVRVRVRGIADGFAKAGLAALVAASSLVAASFFVAAFSTLPSDAFAQSGGGAQPAPGAARDSGLTLRVVGTGHTAPIRRIATSPDQRTLVSVGDDRSVRLWRVEDRRLLQTIWPSAAASEGGRLYGAAFSPAGDEFVVGGDPSNAGPGNLLHVFRADSGALARTLRTPPGKVRRILWTRDGSQVAACSIEPQRFLVLGKDGAVRLDQPLDAPCYALAELPDGTLLAGETGGVIRRFAARDERWTELSRWKTSGTIVTSLAVSPDGRYVAAGFLDDSDSPQSTRVPIVEVLDAATGQSARTWRFAQIAVGNLRTVAWSADGSRILATGSPQRDRGRFLALHLAWPSGEVSESVIASDSILDALAHGSNGFLLAHADSTWSIVRPDAGSGAPIVERQVERQSADLRGAANLRLSPDAKTVGVALRDGREPVEFSLPGRTLRPGRSAHPSATHSTWQLPVSGWENRRAPSVAGRVVELDPIDVSRAASITDDRSAVFLGTNHSLRRLRPDGSVEWAVDPGVETRAVHASGDGRIVVTAMVDGTVRWWRARDGRPLLTLYLQLDGRWIVWTDGGYYDAAPGAESLIGFVRDRRESPGADFFALGRFRDARHRPDVIDRVLETLDPVRALQLADQERRRIAERLEDRKVREQVLASIAPAPVEVRLVPDRVAVARPVPERAQLAAAVAPPPGPPAAVIAPPLAPPPAPPAAVIAPSPAPPPAPPAAVIAPPPAPPPAPPAAASASAAAAPAGVNAQAAMPVPPPVVVMAGGRIVRTQGREVGLDFFLRALGQPATGVVVRVDGRPAEVVRSHLPSMQDGSSVGRLVLRLPERAERITVMAASGQQLSEPVQVDIEWTRPVAPAVAPAAAPAAAPSSAASLPAQRRLIVLAIGVSKYRKSAYSTLRFAAKDADDFAAALTAQHGRLYSSVQSRVLTDALATRAAILESLAWLQSVVQPEDTAIVFLAGHGINDPSGRYHFLGYDADVAQPSTTAVGESEFRGALTRLRGRVLLFADTCYAGGIVGTGAAAASEFARMASSLSSPESGVVVFAASTRQQESLERDQDRNGLFTKVLLEGLSGSADLLGQGQVTHQGLGYFLAQTVRQRTAGAQTPVYVSPLGNTDFALVALR
ncbi:MAG: caspase family protein [Burkholderiaceae bacterium]|nr:caspase family protein [Burkholderiaceae bacterium]